MRHNKNLELMSRLNLGSSGQFVIQGQVAYMLGKTELFILDISLPEKPRLITSLTFKQDLDNLIIQDNILIFREWYRAVNFVDISDPTQPDYFNCLPYIGRCIDNVAKLGDRVLCSSDSQLRLIDTRDPQNAKETQIFDTGSEVRAITCEGNLAYVANDKRGLALFSLEGDQLVEKNRYFEEDSFKVQQVFLGEDRIFLLGYGDDQDFWILDKQDPSKVLLRCEKEGGDPEIIRQVGDNALLFHSHYSCSLSEGLNPPKELFTMFLTDEEEQFMEKAKDEELEHYCSCMENIGHWQVVGNLLYAAQGEEFVVYRVQEGSVFL